MKYKLILLTFLLIMSVGFPAHGINMDQEEKPSIIATTNIVADAVKEIGGGQIEVTTLINIGVDPHDFEATPSDIQAINNSDYIFWLGAGVEEGIEDLLHFWEEQGKSSALIESVNDTELLKGGHEEEHSEEEHDIDPHFWMNPLLWKQAVEEIISILSTIDSDNADKYQSNGDNYLSSLDQLHNSISEEVAQLNDAQKFLVTEHASFSYFAEAYNFTARSLQGISTNTEAGVKEIDELAAYLKEHDIEVVFTESTTPGQNLQAVIDAAKSMGHTVVVGGQLLAGSLALDTDQDTYIEMMQYNTQTIVSAILNPPEPTNNPLPIPAFIITTIFTISILGISRRYIHA